LEVVRRSDTKRKPLKRGGEGGEMAHIGGSYSKAVLAVHWWLKQVKFSKVKYKIRLPSSFYKRIFIKIRKYNCTLPK